MKNSKSKFRKNKKKQDLPRWENNTLWLKKPLDMGGEPVRSIEFDPEMTAEAMNFMKAEPADMSWADVLLVASKLCDLNVNILSNWLGAADKRSVVQYTIFLVLAAG